MDVIGLADVDI